MWIFNSLYFSLLNGLEQKNRLGEKITLDLWVGHLQLLFPTKPLPVGHWNYQPLWARIGTLLSSAPWWTNCVFLLFAANQKWGIWIFFDLSLLLSFCCIVSSERVLNEDAKPILLCSLCRAGTVASLITMRVSLLVVTLVIQRLLLAPKTYKYKGNISK